MAEYFCTAMAVEAKSKAPVPKMASTHPTWSHICSYLKSADQAGSLCLNLDFALHCLPVCASPAQVKRHFHQSQNSQQHMISIAHQHHVQIRAPDNLEAIYNTYAYISTRTLDSSSLLVWDMWHDGVDSADIIETGRHMLTTKHFQAYPCTIHRSGSLN